MFNTTVYDGYPVYKPDPDSPFGTLWSRLQMMDPEPADGGRVWVDTIGELTPDELVALADGFRALAEHHTARG